MTITSPSPPPAPLAPGSASVALRYAERMFDRQRRVLPPAGFEVDWADRPAHHKVYPEATKIALPRPFEGTPAARLDAALDAAPRPSDAPAAPDLATLASALAGGAVTNRRVTLNWNEDTHRKQRPIFADWSRPTPSGGGMYPTETYLVVGPDGPLPVGTYHYDTAHHALDLLTPTDRTGRLARATGVAASTYLVATARLWKNSFKYNSFCYHVVAQDTGALLTTWRLVLGAAGVGVTPRFWFDQGVVATALGVDGSEEPPFVVVPLGPETVPPARDRVRTLAEHGVRTHLPVPWERSVRTRSFPLVDEVNAATWVTGQAPPPDHRARDLSPVPLAVGRLVAPAVELPRPDHAGLGTLQESMARRHSAFGTLASRPGVRQDQLAAVLELIGSTGRLPTDLAGARRTPWVRTWVVAAHVEGLAAGGYAYDPEGHALLPVRLGLLADLQTRYPLQNYNAAEVAATIVLTGRLGDLVDVYGDAGYRFLGLETGQAAQAAYLAATAAGLGVGAVLGVDNVTINDWLGLGPDEHSMLCVFVGAERPVAGYDHRLPGRAPAGRVPRPTSPSMEGSA